MLILYYVLMVASAFFLNTEIYSSIYKHSGNNQQMVLYAIELGRYLLVNCLLLAVYLAFKDPGRLTDERYEDGDLPDEFFELLMKHDPNNICPDCRIVKTLRCRHCYQCDRCIDTFDHHCPWINNCVGRHNFCMFFFFVVTQLIYLCDMIGLLMLCLLQNLLWIPDLDAQLPFWVLLVVIALLATSFFFFFSLVNLCHVQSCNLVTSQTTNERFSRHRDKVEEAGYEGG